MRDLQGLWDAGIEVPVVHHNPAFPSYALRAIKAAAGCSLTDDAERYIAIHDGYTAPIDEPFNTHMSGITTKLFYNAFPTFFDTNNLSLVVFVRYGNFQIVFPGDLEEDGWKSLLLRSDFRAELASTTVLVASHHGRENGYCEEVFDYCQPQVVVMSDKAIVHDTQPMAGTYRRHVATQYPNGVHVENRNNRRHVLTTRRDGHIQFEVQLDGYYRIYTECE